MDWSFVVEEIYCLVKWLSNYLCGFDGRKRDKNAIKLRDVETEIERVRFWLQDEIQLFSSLKYIAVNMTWSDFIARRENLK